VGPWDAVDAEGVGVDDLAAVGAVAGVLGDRGRKPGRE
jgi:hypothetical protein